MRKSVKLIYVLKYVVTLFLSKLMFIVSLLGIFPWFTTF